ncbi:MAG: carotenoid oxygenase family protein [Thermaurantiacus sp.]
MATAARSEDPNARNPYVQGFYAPVGAEVTALDLPVIGDLPQELSGLHVRNGPNPRHHPRHPHHWFDGDGMFHAIRFRDGKAEYRNRWLRTRDFLADDEGGEGACGADGVLVPFRREAGGPPYRDTANTDVVAHAGRLLGLWYVSGMPVAVDPETLDTIGTEDFGGALPRHVSAHSKVDPATGELVYFDYALFEPWMAIGTVSSQGRLTHHARIDLPGLRLPHDMGLTENYQILHDLPVVYSEAGLRQRLWRITFRDQPARFGVVPRTGTNADIRWYETDPCYIYHVVNCWEEGDEVVMIACRMVPNNHALNPAWGDFAPMVNVLKLCAVPVEWRMNLATGACTQRQLDDRIGEFPVVNLDMTGRKTRWSYHVAMAPDELMRFEAYLKYDLETGASTEHRLPPGWAGSEPAFAPRPGATQEDDGWLVSFVTSPEGTSEVQVVDARDFASPPVARIPLPQRVPAGFHGTWMREDQFGA